MRDLVEIGIGRTARRTYELEDINIVPSRRTRDPEDVDISWQIDAFRFELPVLGSAMDGVPSLLVVERAQRAAMVLVRRIFCCSWMIP